MDMDSIKQLEKIEWIDEELNNQWMLNLLTMSCTWCQPFLPLIWPINTLGIVVSCHKHFNLSEWTFHCHNESWLFKWFFNDYKWNSGKKQSFLRMKNWGKQMNFSWSHEERMKQIEWTFWWLLRQNEHQKNGFSQFSFGQERRFWWRLGKQLRKENRWGLNESKKMKKITEKRMFYKKEMT